LLTNIYSQEMKNLDLKQLSKGMHIHDKLRLLFADLNKQSETEGKEIILTTQEKDAILNDARTRGEYREIRRVMEFFKTCTFMVIDLEISQLAALLAIATLEKILMGIMLKGATEEIIDRMIYDWSGGKAEVIGELKSKYKINHVLMKGFDYFISSSESNKELEEYFILTHHHISKLRRKLFEIDFVINKSPVNFLSRYNQNIIEESNSLVQLFINLDAPLKPLKIYKDFGYALTDNFTFRETEFHKLIENISESTDLSDEEKQNLMLRIDSDLDKEL
jgi:hypothetical protein